MGAVLSKRVKMKMYRLLNKYSRLHQPKNRTECVEVELSFTTRKERWHKRPTSNVVQNYVNLYNVPFVQKFHL